MAVAFVSSNNSGAGDNKTVSAPASIVDGNCLVLIAWYFVDGGSPPAQNNCTPPAGFSSAAGRGGKFTVVFTELVGSVQHRITCEVFTKIASGESGNYTVTISDGGWCNLGILQYSGTDLTSPVQAGATSTAAGPSTSSFTSTWTGLTVDRNDSMLLAIFAGYSDTCTLPTGTTARITDLDSIQDVSEIAKNAGASGNTTGTVAGNGGEQNGALAIYLPLQPPSGGADVPTVSSRVPADNANYVAPTNTLTLTYNQAMKAGAGDIILTETGVGVVETIAAADTGQVSFAGSTITITLTATLDPSTSYHVETEADTFLADDDDEPAAAIPGATAWNFRTDDVGALCKTGSVLSGTGALSTTVAVTGAGFMPKLVLLWWSGQTSSTDAVGSNHTRRGFGYAISPTSRGAVTTQSEDASASADCDSGHNTDACVATLSIAGAIDGLLDLQSMDTDGFTLVVDDVMPNSMRLHWMAFGGDELTNVDAGVLTEPGATGNQDITSLSYQPDAALFMSAMIGADPPGTAVDSSCMFGVAAGLGVGGTPANYVWAGGSNNGAATMQTVSYCRGGECIATLAAAVTSTDGHASASGLSNGFRLNWTERAASRRVLWVTLKGGAWFAGDLLTQTDTTTDIVESGFGFQPKGALFLSHGKTQSSSDTIQDHDEWSMGAMDSASSERAMATIDEDATASSNAECTTAVEHDNVYINLSTADAIEGAMQVITVGSDGFTCEMTDADPSQAFVWYLAFGEAPTVAGAMTIEGSGQRLLRTNSAFYNM